MNPGNVRTNLFCFFLLFTTLLSACTKIITTDIGNGLIPPIDGVNTKDTSIDVITKNAGDSVIHPSIADEHVLGYVNDPLFGITTAAINIQLKPPYFPYSFQVNNDSMQLDSIVLVLSYKGIWGDSTQNLALKVFEVSNDGAQPFSSDSFYTNLSKIDVGSTPLNEFATSTLFDPKVLRDSFHVFQDSGNNAIRIRLDPSLGTRFLNYYNPSTTVYQSDTTFNQAFSGFQIAADPTGNALLRIGLLDPNTKLALYYRYTDPDSLNKQDTAVRYFTANNLIFDSLSTRYASAHSNYIIRNRAGALIANSYPSNEVEDSLLYIEASPGVFTRIQIPALTNFPNAIIHRAEIEMEQVPDENNLIAEQYLRPPLLFLAAYGTDSTKRFILFNDLYNIFSGGASNAPDFVNFGSFPISHFNASTNTTSYSYNFDITRYVQGIVTRKDSSYNLVLYAPFKELVYSSPTSLIPFSLFNVPLNAPACGRVRLGGGNSIVHKMKLHIIYSVI